MEMIAILVAQSIAKYGFHKFLDKVFDKKETFINHLSKIILQSIDDYQKKFPSEDKDEKFAFFKSQIILDEFLKFRLFEKKGYIINQSKIQSALEKNTNIIRPTPEQLDKFFEIFDQNIKGDTKLKSLEIEQFHKEKIFEIFDKAEEILSLLRLHLTESRGLLEEVYFEEINDCYSDLKLLKPISALKKLIQLEEKIKKNSRITSESLKANLSYLKGLCLEMTCESNSSYESFIQAYKLFSQNLTYKSRACISYYFLNDPKYKLLKKDIESLDEYEEICWVINTIESEDILGYLDKTVPKNVLLKNRFKRLVLNNNLKTNKVDNLILFEKLEVQKIPKELPELIDYDNLHHWIFMLNVTSITFFQKVAITYWGFLKRNETSMFFLQLSKVLTNSIIQSELEKSYYNIVFIYYWLESELEKNSSTVSHLQDSYSQLLVKDSFRTVLYMNAIQKHLGFEKALEVLRTYKGPLDENILSIKSFCAFNLNGSIESFFEYFEYIQEIHENNIQNICSFLMPISRFDSETTNKLNYLIESKVFSTEAYLTLLRLLINTFSDSKTEIKVEEINQLKANFINESRLSIFIGILFFENNYYHECANYIKSFINEEVESTELALYIRALDSLKTSNQLELLRVLRLWREKFSFNPYFISIELDIRQILKDWDEIILIVNYGLSQLPENEIYFTLLIIALSNRKLSADIHNLVPQAVSFDFKISENAIKVAAVLIEYKYYDEALEIIYKKAKNKSDSIARLNYFALTAELPKEKFSDEHIVAIGTYVKFEIDGQVQTIYIDETSILSPFVNKSIGKHQNDSFSISAAFSKAIKQVRIIRIMNKYLALFDDIMGEINSSFSNLPVESFTFEDSSFEGIKKFFIQNFGVAEAERKKHTEKNLNSYYSYNFSFSELTISNFEGQYLESYYFLTSPESDGFCCIPNKFLSRLTLTDFKNVVVDLTGALLLFEISKELNLSFEKFILPESAIASIDRTINLTEEHRKSKMSISIYGDRIVPHLYNEEFYDKRVKFLTEIRSWLMNNSDVVIPDEKIDIVRNMSPEEKQTPSLGYLIDTSVLAQRIDNILITDDLVFFRYIHTRNKIMNLENFLLQKFPSRKVEILEFLISRRYIGLTLNKEIIYNSYINKNKHGYQHIYNYVLKNISLKQNFNALNIFAVVDFLQELVLNPIISHEKFQTDATNILVILISSFPLVSYNLILKKRIDNKFHLLGLYYDIILKSLINAIKILGRTTK